MRVVLHPEARAEFRAAALWYDEQREGLGEDFSDAITAVLQRIGATPDVFPIWPGTKRAPIVMRRAMVDQFPYAIAFESPVAGAPQEGVVVVLAIAHTKRRPLYWLARGSHESR